MGQFLIHSLFFQSVFTPYLAVNPRLCPMLFQSILSERLHIRPFQADDWAAVYTYMSNPQVTAWLPEGQLDQAQTQAFVSENQGEEAKSYAVVLRGENVLIGHMVYHLWFAPKTYELGWVFHPDYYNRGYATEAARTLIHHSFATLHAHRVIATCQPENIASWRVMEKLGMRREGWFRQCIYRTETLWWDEYFYAILAEEWHKQQKERRGLG
jgi:RimJ/RimL family protein N-acetyltransferase